MEYSREHLKYADHSGFDGSLQYNDCIIWHHSQKSGYSKYQICVYVEDINNESSEEIYKYYKMREDLEQLFEAYLFLNYISMLMCYRIYNLLKDNS